MQDEEKLETENEQEPISDEIEEVVAEMQADDQEEVVDESDETLEASVEASVEGDSLDDDEFELAEDAGFEEDDDEEMALNAQEFSDDDLDFDIESDGELEEVPEDGIIRTSSVPLSKADKNELLKEVISIKASVEAIVFASPKPMKAFEVLEILQDESLTVKDITSILEELCEYYEVHSGGFRLENLKGLGYQFRTMPAAAPYMERMFSKRARPLSRAALETLSIIAYKQPITRAEIEFVRGVDAGSAIKNLIERNIIKCVGRKQDAGRPMLFGTTDEFLKIYQLSSLSELPSLDSFQVSPEVMDKANEKMKDIGEHVAIEGFIGENGASEDVDTERVMANLDEESVEAIEEVEDVPIERAGATAASIYESFDDEDDDDTPTGVEFSDSAKPSELN